MNFFLKYFYKVFPKRVYLMLILVVVANIVSYYGGLLLAESFPVHHWTLALDAFFPVTPIWTFVYVSSYPFWIAVYTMITRDSNPDMVYRLVAADIAGKAVAMLFFVFLPSTLDQPDLTSFGWEAFLLRFIYSADKPLNLFPSLHCFMSWMCFRGIVGCRKYGWVLKLLVLVWCLAIFASTLYTKQHVFVDVIGGWFLAEISFDLAPKLHLMPALKKLNRRLDTEYAH